MPTRVQVCAWFAWCGLVVPSLAAAQDRTEKDVVDLIVRDGPQAQAIRAEADVVRREQQARLAYPNPGLTYSREGAGFTEFLQIEQPLPAFGARAALSRAGVAATAAAEADRDARLWLLRADAAATIARLDAAQAYLEAARSHTREIERLIEILQTREREGEGPRFDRLRAEQELRDARSVASSAAIDVAEARASLAAMLPADAIFTRVVPSAAVEPAAPSIDALIRQARSSRAELRVLLRMGERAELESQAARRARLPVPTLYGGLKRADDGAGRQTGGVLGVSASLALFDPGRLDAARWSAERARRAAERAALERRIQAEIVGASETLALRQAAVVQDAEGTADELMRVAEVAYREGEMGILELLDAVRTASRARTRSIGLRRDVRLAQITLERAVGDVLWP